jgi:hypothetical protein
MSRRKSRKPSARSTPPTRTSVLNLRTAPFGSAFLEECLARVRFAKAEGEHYGPSACYGDRVETEILNCLHEAKDAGEREAERATHARYRTDSRGIAALGEIRHAISRVLNLGQQTNLGTELAAVLSLLLKADNNLRYALGIDTTSVIGLLQRNGVRLEQGTLPEAP